MVLGGSWVVISRVISGITTVITYLRGLLSLLLSTHEPPSRAPLKNHRILIRALTDPLKEA